MEEPRQLPLADELAVRRTLLANERTLMAYLRSGMALIIAGVTIVHFAEAGWFAFVGIACVPLGIAVAILGLARFRRVQSKIRAAAHRANT